MTNKEDEKPYVAPFIRRVMEGKSEEEILEASENLKGYLRAMYQIYLRQQRVAREQGRLKELEEEQRQAHSEQCDHCIAYEIHQAGEHVFRGAMVARSRG